MTMTPSRAGSGPLGAGSAAGGAATRDGAGGRGASAGGGGDAGGALPVIETSAHERGRPSPDGFGAADKPLVFIDGLYFAKRDAMVSVFDHGLLYGDGCFEGIRIYNGQIFKARTHMDRIYRNAERLHMHRQGGDKFGRNGNGMPYTPDEMIEIMRTCVKANGIREGYIRLIFTRGAGGLGLNPFMCPRPTVICIADTIRLYPEEMYASGMKVIVAKRPRTPAVCLDPQLKSLNYLNNIMAKVEAIDASPADAPPTDQVLEAIMLSYSDDPKKRIVGECTGDNLFIVKDGTVFTSPLGVPMLDGITRAFVMKELAPMCGIGVTEKVLTLDDVLGADEVFLTGSAAEIIAVRQIDDTVVSDGEGPVTKRLRSAFREVVSRDRIPTD
ncbi:MAG: aminotransferase class IV [Phycisphaerales bacterium]